MCATMKLYVVALINHHVENKMWVRPSQSRISFRTSLKSSEWLDQTVHLLIEPVNNDRDLSENTEGPRSIAPARDRIHMSLGSPLEPQALMK